MATTLNPSDKDVNATLSNGNLTVTKTGTPYSAVRSTTSKSSGVWYWETTIDSLGGTSALEPGVADASETLASIAGASGNHGFGYTRFADGIIYEGATYTHAALGGTVGDVYCHVLDIGNKNYWVRKNSGLWNNTSTSDPSTNTLGFNNDTPNFNITHADLNTLFGSALFVHIAVYNGSQVTVNFGATSFAFTKPSGATAWDAGLITAGITQTLLKPRQSLTNIRDTFAAAQTLKKARQTALAKVLAAPGNTAFTAAWTIG